MASKNTDIQPDVNDESNLFEVIMRQLRDKLNQQLAKSTKVIAAQKEALVKRLAVIVYETLMQLPHTKIKEERAAKRKRLEQRQQAIEILLADLKEPETLNSLANITAAATRSGTDEELESLYHERVLEMEQFLSDGRAALTKLLHWTIQEKQTCGGPGKGKRESTWLVERLDCEAKKVFRELDLHIGDGDSTVYTKVLRSMLIVAGLEGSPRDIARKQKRSR